MPISCPRDAAPLTVGTVDGNSVRRCGKCHGLWVGYMALERLANVRVRRFLAAGARAAATPANLRCPADGRLLRPVIAGGVEIDVCADCKGVWLDRLELERIRVQLPPAPATEGADVEDAADTAEALADLDPGFLRRTWRWIEEHLPDSWDGGDADIDF